MAKNEKILVIKHGALGDILQGFDAFAKAYLKQIRQDGLPP